MAYIDNGPGTNQEVDEGIVRCISAWAVAFFVFVVLWVALRVCGLSFDMTALILTPPLVVVAWKIPSALE